MKFCKKTDYAIFLIDVLKPTYFSGEFISIADIAKKHQLPKMLLEKLAGSLRMKKILASRKGKEGGYRLRINPAELTMLDIVTIFEDTDVMKRLRPFVSVKECPMSKVYSAKKRWKDIDEKIHTIFKETTFA
jgi:Rrf2 family protein